MMLFMRTKQKKTKKNFVGVLLDEDLHEKIKAQAKAEGGSVSYLIRRACKLIYQERENKRSA